MAARSWLTALVLLAGCKACRGGQSDTQSQDSSDTEDSAGQDSGDTAVVTPPRCDFPEAEPNGTPTTAQALPLEALGCGDINPALDADMWSFTLDHGAWIAVDVESEAIGDRADMGLILVDETRGDTAQVIDGPYGKDVHLRFPAQSGRYTLALTEMDGLFGEVDYGYELLVSEVKEPTTWNGVAPEPNESRTDALPIHDGAVWFGDIADAFDQDWFVVDVPAGKHLLSARIDAFELGSAAQLRLSLFNSTGANLANATGGDAGWDRDPTLTRLSAGSERLYLKLADRTGRGGHAYWYVLTFALEAQ